MGGLSYNHVSVAKNSAIDSILRGCSKKWKYLWPYSMALLRLNAEFNNMPGTFPNVSKI